MIFANFRAIMLCDRERCTFISAGRRTREGHILDVDGRDLGEFERLLLNVNVKKVKELIRLAESEDHQEHVYASRGLNS